jgi:hypothetical protein
MSTSRATISIDADLFEKAQRRAKALNYRGGFSEYVAFLISKDVTERPKHVVVREEASPEYRTKKRKRTK